MSMFVMCKIKVTYLLTYLLIYLLIYLLLLNVCDGEDYDDNCATPKILYIIYNVAICRFFADSQCLASRDAYSDILLDALATQPTPEVAVMMLRLVRSGELSGLRASLMINAMSLVVRPTPIVILTALVGVACISGKKLQRRRERQRDK